MMNLPKALVVQWNGRKYYVRCPYCLEIHCHNYPLGDRQRLSHCDDMNREGYELIFPEEDDPAADGFGWEVDQVQHAFVAVTSTGRLACPSLRQPYRSLLSPLLRLDEQTGADNTRDEESGVAEIESATEQLSVGEQTPQEFPPPEQTIEEIFQELLASPKYRRDLYVSACILRRIGELCWLFERYPEDNFSTQTNEEGSNGVLLAATEENGFATVEWLHERGTTIDQSNQYGRTPLMEAALWGRLKTVQYLTAHGADVHARDANGMSGADFAAASKRNTGERALRARGVYREPADAPAQRTRIENHLKHFSSAQTLQPGAHGSSPRGCSLFQRTAEGDLFLYRVHTLLQVPNGQSQKAFAELDRGPNYPLVNAMSGYSYAAWPNVLDNDLWASRANDLRDHLGLPRNIGLASHVEPQLLAYLLFHHSLVIFTGHGSQGRLESLQYLLGDLRPVTLAAIVTVTKSDFCPSCSQFFEEFRLMFGSLDVQFRFAGDNGDGEVQIRSL